MKRVGSWPYGDPNYHSEGDIPERSDVGNAARQVRATLAAVLGLDQSRQPVSVGGVGP